MRRTKELGVEIDTLNPLEVLKRYFNLRYAYPDYDILIYHSSSGRGLHFEVKGRQTNLVQRATQADCHGRLKCSEINGEDFLACSKRWFENGEIARRDMRSRIEAHNILALPFCSQLSRGFYVAKGVVG